MNTTPLHLTQEQEDALIQYALRRKKAFEEQIQWDARPPLWMQLLAPVGFIVFGVAVLIYSIRHSAF